MTPDSQSSFDALLREAAELRVPSGSAIALPEPGTVVQGKYRIEEELAQGGMGAVFRAVNVETGKQVALKWLLGRTPQAGLRFSREARVAAKIDHPNVVNVFDSGSHEGGRYLVMELLRGESLGTRIRRERIPADELVEIMIPVLRGLAAAHQAGVIHRDLKPDNVFLCVGPDGAERPPKVLDFGISKLRNAPPLDERLTGQGTGLGTLAYMSPEQLVDAPSVDERTDIYAAGAMMYEALTGCLPFRADGYNALVLAIAAQRPLPMAALVADVPASLERIVMRAMAKEPAQRQPDVRTLIAELEALRDDGFTSKAPGGRFASSRRARWGWALCAGLPLSIAIWSAGHPPHSATQTASLPTALASTHQAGAEPKPPIREADAHLTAGERESAPNDRDGATASGSPARAAPSARARTGQTRQARPHARSRAGNIRWSDL